MLDELSVRIRLSEQKRLESSAEGRQRWRRHNIRWQAFPHLRASKPKMLVCQQLPHLERCFVWVLRIEWC